MKKYLIKFNAGFGEETEVVEAETQEEATTAAYDAWRESAENNADYEAILLTKEIAEEYGFEDALQDDQ